MSGFSDEQQLSRLRVAVSTNNLPTDLGEWVLNRMAPFLRRSERNKALLQAAEYLEGSIRSKAKALLADMVEFRSDAAFWTMPDTGEDYRACIVRALVFNDHTPMSDRQIRRILGQMGD